MFRNAKLSFLKPARCLDIDRQRSSESFQTTSVSDSYFKKSKRDYDQTKEKLMKKTAFYLFGAGEF